jgi:hypothetical protein
VEVLSTQLITHNIVKHLNIDAPMFRRKKETETKSLQSGCSHPKDCAMLSEAHTGLVRHICVLDQERAECLYRSEDVLSPAVQVIQSCLRRKRAFYTELYKAAQREQSKWEI